MKYNLGSKIRMHTFLCKIDSTWYNIAHTELYNGNKKTEFFEKEIELR